MLQPLKVTGLGLSSRLITEFEVFFERICKGDLEFGSGLADVVIVDLDAYGAKKQLASYPHFHPKQGLLLISSSFSEALSEEARVWRLRKPYSMENLRAAIKAAQARILTLKTAATQPGLNSDKSGPGPRSGARQREAETAVPEMQSNNAQSAPSQPADQRRHRAAEALSQRDMEKLTRLSAGLLSMGNSIEERGQFDPSEYLFGQLVEAQQQALERSCLVSLMFPQGEILLDPQHHRVELRSSEFNLRMFASMPFQTDSLSITYLPTGSFESERQGAQSTLDALIWKTAVYASRGRYSQDADINDFVQLRQWPNLSRLLLFPNAVRVAALWVKSPHTPMEIAELLGIPRTDVFSFYTAAQALGLFRVEQVKNTSVPTSDIQPQSPKHGLLTRILARLTRE